jgi:hypothetical protein
MIRFLILLLSFTVVTNGFAQDFSSRHMKSVEARNKTFRLLQAKSFNLIQVNVNLTDLKNSPYNIDEIEQLLIISSSFEQLVRFSKEYGKLSNSFAPRVAKKKSIWFSPDSLSIAINECLKTNKTEKQEQIDKSDLNGIEKDYLKQLLLFHLLTYDYCDEQIENELLSSSRLFVHTYSEPDYKFGVNRYFNIEYKPTNWGIGFYIVSGGLFPTGNLKNYIPDGVPINWGLSLNYKRIYLIAGYGPGIGGELKKEIYYQKLWRQGDNIIYAMGETYLGYNLINKDRIGITPIIGFHGVGLSPSSTDNKEYYEDVDNLVPYTSLAYGVNIDLKWGYSNCRTKSIYARGAGKDKLFWMTRVSIGYGNPKFDKFVEGMNGGLFFVKVGLAFQYQFKRKKNG